MSVLNVKKLWLSSNATRNNSHAHACKEQQLGHGCCQQRLQDAINHKQHPDFRDKKMCVCWGEVYLRINEIQWILTPKYKVKSL